MAGPGRPRRLPAAGRLRGSGRPSGRPRRNSDSTVASVDLAHINYIPESSVLKPTKLPDSDAWPCFVLRDAVVYRKTADGQLKIANVCNVDLEGPFVIRGMLDIDLDSQRQYLRKYPLKSSYIEIAASVSYSIGYEPCAIWAAGRAGWFEINPAPEYVDMYHNICEGVDLYYLIMDVYLKSKERAPKAKRAKVLQMQVEKLLFKYAVATGEGLTLPDAENRCNKHALFLLAHFSKEQEINWNATSFKKWMTTRNEDLVTKLANAVHNRPAELPPPDPGSESDITETKSNLEDQVRGLPLRIPSTDSDRSRRSKSRASRQSQETDIEMKDAQQPLRVTPIFPPRPGQVPSAPGAVPYTPPATNASLTGIDSSSQSPEDPVHVLLGLLEEILEETGDVTKVKEATVHSRMYFKCSIKDYPAPKEITHYYATRLVASMSPKWYNSPFFQWLKIQRSLPWTPNLLTPNEVVSQCVRRKPNTGTGPSKNTTRRTSPTGPRGAGKHFIRTPRPSGKNAVLRPGTSSKRPTFTDDDDDEAMDEDRRPHKFAKTSYVSDNDEGDETGEDDDEEVNDSGDTATPAVPHSTTSTPAPLLPKDTVKIVVRAEKIPSISPTGPNGTWKCEEEGCNYIVRSADELDGKELISMHFQEHTARAEKINLALTEGTRGHLPINHLLEKIRTLGDTSKNNDQSHPDDSSFPQPIKRRLLI